MNILVWLGSKDMHPAIYPNMKSIADALADMGHNVITCDTSSFDEVEAAMVLLREEKFFDLSIGVNAMGMKVRLNEGDIVNTFADLDTTHISILLDEPFNPHCNGFAHLGKHHIITYLDRSDAEYLSRYNLAQDKVKVFMPLGGTMSGLSFDELMIRKKNSSYNVVVSAGKFSDKQQCPRWADYGAAPQMVKILDEIIELLQTEAINIVGATLKVLASHNLEENVYFKSVGAFFAIILLYIKNWRRQKMLDELLRCGVKVDLFGSDWEEGDFAKGVTLHGVVPYAEMLQVITEAKIVLNDEACFNDGAHDRVFTSMLNGAVVISEYSDYLAEEFTHGEDFFMFDWQNIGKCLQIIPQLMQEESYRESIAANAYAKAVKRHTWHHRAVRLLEAAELVQFYDRLQGQEK